MLEVVCAIIEREDGKILAAQRGLDRVLSGLWEFPGGKIEPNETPQQALIREIQEELGVSISVGPCLRVSEFAYEGGDKIRLSGFWARILSGKPECIEHKEIRWISKSESSDICWASADLELLKAWVESKSPEFETTC